MTPNATHSSIVARNKARGFTVRFVSPEGRECEFHPATLAERADFIRRCEINGYTVKEPTP